MVFYFFFVPFVIVIYLMTSLNLKKNLKGEAKNIEQIQSGQFEIKRALSINIIRLYFILRSIFFFCFFILLFATVCFSRRCFNLSNFMFASIFCLLLCVGCALAWSTDCFNFDFFPIEQETKTKKKNKKRHHFFAELKQLAMKRKTNEQE